MSGDRQSTGEPGNYQTMIELKEHYFSLERSAGKLERKADRFFVNAEVFLDLSRNDELSLKKRKQYEFSAKERETEGQRLREDAADLRVKAKRMMADAIAMGW